MSQSLRGKYNYYEMKGINMQDNRYVQQSNVDRLESESEVSEPKHVTSGKSTIGRLFVLDASTGEIFSMNADGSDKKVIVSGCRTPDGIVVDVEAGHIYWTDMGIPNVNDGSIERANIDGQNRTMIVPPGGTFTPKQLHLDSKNGKLYWSDREGMRVMRSNLDGSKIETLVQNGQGDEDRRDQMKWCVGITVDVGREQFYWTQKGPDDAGKGRIFRASTEIPNGYVFFSNRRPGYQERYGLTAEELCSRHPGLIHAKVTLCGETGPWSNRTGYDEVAGAVTGVFALEGTPNNPRLPSIHVVCDNIAGWLSTLGIMSALRRRAVEGGSYRVVVSLTRVTLWLLSLGIFDKKYARATAGSSDEHTYVAPDLFTADTPLGLYQGVTEQVEMSRTPGSFRTVLVPRGSSKAEWES